VLAVAHVGGEFWVGYFIFGYIQAIYIYLGCFGARGRAGGSAKALENAFQKSGFPIRQAVPVGLLGLGFALGLVVLGFS
jgi:hypothetical protein